MTKRVLTAYFMHETNTFQPQKTTYEDFAAAGDRQPLVRGPGVLEKYSVPPTNYFLHLKFLPLTAH